MKNQKFVDIRLNGSTKKTVPEPNKSYIYYRTLYNK